MVQRSVQALKTVSSLIDYSINDNDFLNTCLSSNEGILQNLGNFQERICFYNLKEFSWLDKMKCFIPITRREFLVMCIEHNANFNRANPGLSRFVRIKNNLKLYYLRNLQNSQKSIMSQVSNFIYFLYSKHVTMKLFSKKYIII